MDEQDEREKDYYKISPKYEMDANMQQAQEIAKIGFVLLIVMVVVSVIAVSLN